ncbi:alpha/beta hydrolase [Amycolatopsis minnesotensis]|uniref:Alpha/beta hydrolase n=1 Tax=Amycolatopsis minnesotensis TaxID=337894 RepID=A0ABN2QEY1_9PSEU
MIGNKIRTALVLGSAVLATAAVAPVAAASASGVVWERCPGESPQGYACGHLEVPLSYQDTGGKKITIALAKLPATDPAHRLGTVFYNPGGPGVSGRFAPKELMASLGGKFDLVGFDPRGVGASGALRCFTDPAQLGTLQAAIGFPITAAQDRAQLAAAKTVTDLCAANGGELMGHLSTASVARDLDRLRAAFGEPKLKYYGKSYGSVLGETYANLFGDRVGALVLDAVDDPVNWSTGYRPQDAAKPFSFRLDAFPDAQRALESFLRSCAAAPQCAFREPGTDLLVRYNGLLDRLQRGPVATTDPETGQPLTVGYQDLVSRVHNGLLDTVKAPALARFLQAVAIAPDTGGSAPPTAARTTATGATIPTPADSLLGGAATLCSDSLNPRDPRVWAGFARLADRSGRGFGAYDTYKSLPCATWPVRDPGRYTGPWNRQTAAPVLLVGNRQGDPETPYPGAQRTERALANARLLTLDTYGHGSVGRSACVDSAAQDYLERGTLPARGTVCAPDRGPFG